MDSINKISCSSLVWHDDNFYYRSSVILAGIELKPVLVSGSYGCSWFAGWSGVGYSTHEFSMKAFQDQKDNIYKPSHDYNFMDSDTGHQYHAGNSFLELVHDVPDYAIKSIVLKVK